MPPIAENGSSRGSPALSSQPSSPPSSSLSFSEPSQYSPSQARAFSDLPPLDLDDLPPLPPAQSFSSSPLAHSRASRNSRQGQLASPSLSPHPLSYSLNGSPISPAKVQPSPLSLPRLSTISPEVQALDENLVPGARHSFEHARYVTVSAVLSRTGVCYPISGDEQGRAIFGQGQRVGSLDGAVKTGETPASRRQKDGRASRKRPSNGSALEALGAMFLHRDSAGKVSSLSLTRDDHRLTATGETMSRAWIERLREAGAERLGIRLPKSKRGSGEGRTIAERRARRWESLLGNRTAPDRAETSLEEDGQRFRRVGSGRGQPSFEVRCKERSSGKTILDATWRTDHLLGSTLPAGEQGIDSSRVYLQAGQRLSKGRSSSSSTFGQGSFWGETELPDAPPSPIGMPGAWSGGNSWRSKPGDGYEEGALLLPPPLLDDQGSDPNSFEGLLGIRRMREQEKARKHLQRLRARNRPTHKVGPLTALTNFVKAAHAAENSARKKRPPTTRMLSDWGSSRLSQISQTLVKPLQSVEQTTSPRLVPTDSATESESESQGLSQKTNVANTVVSNPLATSGRRSSLSRTHSRMGSVDMAVRQLNTVFEAETFDPLVANQDDATSPALPPLSSPALRPSSRASSTSSLREVPAAPRLLPIQLSLPPSPFTPLAVDSRTYLDRNSSNSSLSSEYASARPQPLTPRLGPTHLSLPPSPWTPHQGDQTVMHPQSQYFHLHLNSSTSSLRAPGTPRLVPTHLEIVPSPFPTPTQSRRGSLSQMSPPNPASLVARGRAGKKTSRSPLSQALDSASLDGETGLPSQKQTLLDCSEHAPSRSRPRRIGVNDHSAKESGRLTPSSMFSSAQTLDALDLSESSKLIEPRHQLFANDSADGRLSPKAVLEDKPSSFPPDRSFFLWFLVGDLGLSTRKSVASAAAKVSGSPASPAGEADLGGLAGILMHIFGFTTFCLAHLLDLLYVAFEDLSMAFWFLRWLFLNLTGRTILSRCAIDAYKLIQTEWATVALEDHEEKGSKKRRGSLGEQTPKGLTRWQVLRGLLELICLHNVTRERYLRDGAGLVKLEGWKKKRRGQLAGGETSGMLDIGAQKEAARKSIAELASSRDASDSENDYDDDSDQDSSDDEMIITNQGTDILEFSKTSRFERRGSHSKAANGYFPSATYRSSSDSFNLGSPEVVARSGRKLSRGTSEPLEEDARGLISTIKWASRLAISAYGLHVHIVDLPPTFTPSGNRFSRQTFAYLSRLDADDVLHADIQTLDSDAEYCPTFYIVRDYVRRVVCVAVRGTQSFSDIIVDLEMRTEAVELPHLESKPGEEFRCHAGIWRAAKALISRDSTLYVKLKSALEENEGFGVVFCGHSLGGAIASAAALLLGEYKVPPGARDDRGLWYTNRECGLPPGRSIRALSFANPVTMTAPLAHRAAMGAIPLVTTVVLGSDIIPRAGHGQAREIRRVLGALSRVRRRHEFAFEKEGGVKEDARIHILRSFWDWWNISRATNPDAVMLDRKEKIEEQLWALRREVESELYAAVKRRHEESLSSRGLCELDDPKNRETAIGEGLGPRNSQEDGVSERDEEDLEPRGPTRSRSSTSGRVGTAVPPSPWVGPQQRDSAPLHQLASRRQALDSATLRSEAAQGGPLVPAGKCIWIDDSDSRDLSQQAGEPKKQKTKNEVEVYHVTSPLSFFSLPDFQTGMFAQHFPAAYEEAVLKLRS
ncbi:hypothetical protein IE53DRAFT_376278 [Violaceomyces palustris]|uniref:Uncharacterized protein n=1 Tax=Violaceomyces palustris TaxID=1673888 RepID=A0ACD0NM81_9BASI|nr:hypothetical protein IE53DRAFT_376278 [Violaceomyces palustris]